MITLPTKDYWGFYQVGEFKVYSKLEAIELSSKINKPIEWDFNKRSFSNFNWSVEPPGDINFWYKQRALQLRERYEYLVLFYSGGADSYNMLMAFVNNGIFVDEIVQLHTLEGNSGDKDTFANAEVFYTSIPSTQKLINDNPVYKNTKHRVIDISKWQKNMFHRAEYRWDVWYELNSILTPSIAVWSHIREIEPSYRKIMDSGKTLCFVWGYDKPNIDHSGTKCRLVFRDAYASAYVNPVTATANLDNEFDEPFYFSATMPELVSKQAHIIKRFLEAINDSVVDEIHVSIATKFKDEYGLPTHYSRQQPVATILKNNKKYSLMPAGLHKLIYPVWNPIEHPILCGKTTSLTLTERDLWVIKDPVSDTKYDRYFKGLVWLKQYVKQKDPTMWHEFKQDIRKNIFSGCMAPLTNSYLIGD